MSSRELASNDNALSTRCSLADIDRHVSARVRNRRILLGLSVQEFAQHIGVTYQQACKYEWGKTRLTAGRLSRIAKALDVEVDYFFAGPILPQEFCPSEQQRALFELIRNVAHIPDRRMQENFCAMARLMAEGVPGQ